MNTDLVGKEIHNYRVQRLLGEGGMASVYLALHERLGRTAAIKVIRMGQFPPNLLDNVLRRFEVEARALAAMDHPHIVRVFDYGEFGGMPYLVMEHLPGGALTTKTGSPMRFDRAAALLRPIAAALEYAHQRGVLHRDVKPSNILFAADGRPVLTDFGIARLTEQTEGAGLTSTGVGIGTPDYMAPEQGMGHPVDGRADVYALGVVLYELVTGHRPYGGTTPMEVIMQHFTAPLPPPERYIPELPPLVSQGITRALEKEPETRYENMAALGAALEAMAHNDPGSLRAVLSEAGLTAEATFIQPPPAAPEEATTVQAPVTGRPSPRDTGPTVQVPGYAPQTPAPQNRTGPTSRPAQPVQRPPGPPAPPPAIKPGFPWGWLALGGTLIILLIGAAVIWAAMQNKGQASAPPTLITFPTSTSTVEPATHTPLPAVTAMGTSVPTNLPTNTPAPMDTIPPPTWTSQVIVVTATPMLNPDFWFPQMPASASSLGAGDIQEVTNEEVAGNDKDMLDLFAKWGRITSYERFYTHPDLCDSPDLYGVYIQTFVFNTSEGAGQFFDWAHEGFTVEFVSWAGDQAYLFRNTSSNDKCTEDRVSLTFTRGSLAARVRMRGVGGKMSDAQLVAILKEIAADIDSRFIQHPK